MKKMIFTASCLDLSVKAHSEQLSAMLLFDETRSGEYERGFL